MAENRALLAPVLERPDADGPRVAYADWCASQSDPPTQARAEFIRGSIELFRTSASLSHEPRLRLTLRVETLEQAHREAWLRPLAGLVDDARFDRGFVELVALPAQRFLSLAPQIFAQAPVRHLRLTEARASLRELAASPYLDAIRSLDLCENGLTDADVALLAASPHIANIRWLSLGYNEIGIDGAEALATSPYLRDLRYASLSGNPVDPCEKYSPNDHMIADTWLPEAGELLEQRHGRIPWLHIQGETVFDAIPSRFRIGR